MSWKIQPYRTSSSYRDYIVRRTQIPVLMDPDVDRALDTLPVHTSSHAGAVRRFIDLPNDKTWRWLYDLCEFNVRMANRDAGWNFKLNGWHQPLRFNLYERGDQFVTHSDYFSGDRSKVAFVLPVRHATGGDTYLTDVDLPDPLAEGLDMLVFPAFHPHGVTPVEAGMRVALVGWATGPRFV